MQTTLPESSKCSTRLCIRISNSARVIGRSNTNIQNRKPEKVSVVNQGKQVHMENRKFREVPFNLSITHRGM